MRVKVGVTLALIGFLLVGCEQRSQNSVVILPEDQPFQLNKPHPQSREADSLAAKLKPKRYIKLWPQPSDRWPQQIRPDRVLIFKGTRQLYLMYEGYPYKAYRIALGRNPRGPKRRQGDGRTPEGEYYIESKNPESDYYLALKISYPNGQDREQASAMGVAPGGQIMLHGLPNQEDKAGIISTYHPDFDWTDGCIALTNEEIRELYQIVSIGTPIEIRP